MAPSSYSEVEEKEEKEKSTGGLSKSESRRQYGVLLTIIFLQFVSRAADTIVYPFFPATAVDNGLTMTEVGIIFSAYDLSRFLSSPVLGSLLLKWPPKSMCAVGTLITGLACAGFGNTKEVKSREWFLGLCLIIRIIAGVGSTMVTIASTSILLKASSFSSSTVIGLAEMVSGFAFLFGPALGAALYGLAGYSAVFWVFGGLLVLMIPVFLIVVPSVVEEATEGKKSFFDLLAIPGCLLMFAVCTVVRINGSSRNVGLSEYLIMELHESLPIVGLLYGVSSSFYIIGCLVITRIVNKFPSWTYRLLIFGWLLLSLDIFLLGPSPLLNFIFHGSQPFWLAFVVMICVNLTSGFIYIPPFPAALDLADVNGHPRESLHTYGMVTGLVNSGWSLGATTGPVITGAIIDALNFQWTQTCLAFTDVFMAALLLTYLLYMRLTNQPIAPTKGSDERSPDDIQTDRTSKAIQQVADACQDRMEACLKNSGDLTQLHHQQPAEE